MKAPKGEKRRALNGAVAAAALALAASSATPALAQTGASASTSHVYAGATFGQAHWRPGCPDGVSSCDDTGRSLSVFGGYQINRMFSAEVAFRNLSNASAPGLSIKSHAWEAVGIAAWPVVGALSVYGKLGIFRSKAEGSGSLVTGKETNYGPTFGIGAQLELSRNVALRGEWQSYSGVGGSTLPKSDINVMSVGALWRFQ